MRCIACLSKINSVRFPKPNNALILDDDVVAEETRVKECKPGDLKIKV